MHSWFQPRLHLIKKNNNNKKKPPNVYNVYKKHKSSVFPRGEDYEDLCGASQAQMLSIVLKATFFL